MARYMVKADTINPRNEDGILQYDVEWYVILAETGARLLKFAHVWDAAAAAEYLNGNDEEQYDNHLETGGK